MTAPDPRSRPSRGHETPIDGTATTRTDAPVQPHDADALDAWLESVTANGAPSIGHGNGRSPHHSPANGSGPSTGDTPLVATARHFHARIGHAEASHATDGPETTLEAIIWERIMSSQLASNQPTTVQQSPRLSIQARPQAQSDGASEGRPFPIIDRFAGSHPAFSAVLAAAVILAIVAIFRVIGAPPSGPTDDSSSTTGPASNPALAALGSPVSSPTASDAERWVTDPNNTTCAIDLANLPGAVDGNPLGSTPDAGLVPFGNTSSINQTAAAEVYLQVQQCGGFDGPAVETLMSDRFAEKLTVLDSDNPPGLTAEEMALGRQISDTYTGEDPMSFVIEGEPLPRDASSPGYGSASRRVLLPDDVVQLADGRIGGPAHVFFRTNDPSGAASYLGPQGVLETGFVIFTAEDDRWVIDDYLLICIGDCDAYWASREAEGTPAAGPETGDIVSLGASGSLIVGEESELRRVPLDGGMPEPLPVTGYSSAIRTSQPNVVILDDAEGKQVAYNAATGITSKTFSTRNITSVANVGPYRVISYSDPVDLLFVDLRTMRLTSLADLAGGGIDIGDPAFTVQGDESGNLIVGITSAGDPGSTSAVAASIDRDGEHVRILERWTASGQVGISGAISPDGTSIAYPAYKDGAVVIRTETITGEPIRDHAWSDTSRIRRMAFINPTDLIVFSTDTNVVSPLPDGTASGGTVATIRTIAGEADIQTVVTVGDVANLQGPFVSPDGTNILYARNATINGVEQPVWYLLNVESGRNMELLDLRDMETTLSVGDPTIRELVPLVGSSSDIDPADQTDTFAWTTFDLTTGKLRESAALKTVNRHIVDSPDHSVVAGFAPDTPTRREGSEPEEHWSVQMGGTIVVVDGLTDTTYAKPIPGNGTEWVIPKLLLSPDGEHIAFSAYGSDESTPVHRTWVASRETGSRWIEIGPYMLYDWVAPAQHNQTTVPKAEAPATPATAPAGTPVARAAIPAAPDDGTLLIDNGSAIISRPLDGSPEATLATYDQSEPPIYRRTTVPDIVMGSDAKTAHNVRTGQVLGTNPYESDMVIGPFWVQYTSQNPAVPVDARIVDLRTMESVGFFDLAGVDPAGLGPQWLIEGTESGTLGVGFIDRAETTGPTLTPTMLLIDGDLEHTRVVPLWSPRGTDGDVLAFSPDGSLVAYLTGTEGNVVIRVETIAGEPIGDIPWPEDTPVAHMVLPDAQTLLIMSEGEVLRADLASGTRPAPIAGYADEIWNTILSPDGSHLLFATFDPVTGSNGQDNMAWHWIDIGTGEVRPIPQATGGHPFWPGPSYTADTVMLWVPVGSLNEGTYRVLFVDMTTGAVTVAQPTGVTSGLAPGETISEDGAVFAAYGIGSPDAPRFQILEGWGSIPLNGQLVVFDRASRSVVQIPFPDSGLPQETIEPALTVSPDGRHIVLSVRWTDDSGEQAQSWITTTDGQGAWTPVEGGLVVGWVGE